jgi:hypothetical protein
VRGAAETGGGDSAATWPTGRPQLLRVPGVIREVDDVSRDAVVVVGLRVRAEDRRLIRSHSGIGEIERNFRKTTDVRDGVPVALVQDPIRMIRLPPAELLAERVGRIGIEQQVEQGPVIRIIGLPRNDRGAAAAPDSAVSRPVGDRVGNCDDVIMAFVEDLDRVESARGILDVWAHRPHRRHRSADRPKVCGCCYHRHRRSAVSAAAQHERAREHTYLCGAQICTTSDCIGVHVTQIYGVRSCDLPSINYLASGRYIVLRLQRKV